MTLTRRRNAEQLSLFGKRSPLEDAEAFEYFPATRWLQLNAPSEEALNDLAYYVALHATQDELREFVWDEIGVNVRRVFPTNPGDEVFELLPGWLYLDYGITLVKTEPRRPKGIPLPPGELSRDELRGFVNLWHEHFKGTSHIYSWGYAIYNGPPGPDALIGVALVGRPAPTTGRRGAEGTGPKVATVLRVAMNRDVPRELTYEATGAVYDAAAEEASQRGFDFLETYTLFSETGQSLRYANWAAPGISRTQSRWRKTGIAKARKRGRRGELRDGDERKWRWWKRLTPEWPWPEKPKRNPSAPAVMRKLKGKVGEGDCYVASELVYHAGGGKRAGLTPVQQQHQGESHWWVMGPEGEVYDPTAHQYNRPVPYHKGRGRGFLTKRASKRARALGREVGVRVNPDWRDHTYRRRPSNQEMEDAEQRVLAAGALPPLDYMGAGAQGIVFCGAEGRAWKASRGASDPEWAESRRSSARAEYEWLKAASEHPTTKHMVPKVYAFHEREAVIERGCPRGKEPDWLAKHSEWHAQLDVPGWTRPEAGRGQWVVTPEGPVIVDGGMAARRGEVLAKHIEAVLDGRIPSYGERLRDMAWSVYVDTQQTHLPPWRGAQMLRKIRAAGDDSEFSSEEAIARFMPRGNPPAGDERLRQLERAAAAGDQSAKEALGHALTRAGQCADCGIVLPTAPPPGSSVIPVAGSESGLKRCIACAAELDLVLVRARRPIAGYLFEIHSREGWPRTAGNTYAVGNFMGFPLLAVTELAGARFGYTGRGLAYSAVDTDQGSWYGRSREVGYVTTARPKKFTEGWLIRGSATLRAAQREWMRLAREDPTGASLKARAKENPPAGDERVRQLERRWKETGGREDAVAYLNSLRRYDNRARHYLRRLDGLADDDEYLDPPMVASFLNEIISKRIHTDQNLRAAITSPVDTSGRYIMVAAWSGPSPADPWLTTKSWGHWAGPLIHLSLRDLNEASWASPRAAGLVFPVRAGRLPWGGDISFAVPLEVVKVWVAVNKPPQPWTRVVE